MAAYMRSSFRLHWDRGLMARSHLAILRRRQRLPDSIFKELATLSVKGPSLRRCLESRYGCAIPRRDAPELLHEPPSRREGAGNAGCALHPQPVCIGSKHTVVTTGTPVSAGIPCTMVLTVSFVLPGDEFLFVTVAGGLRVV